MISMMIENIEKHVDFERLKYCNGICQKWGQRFKTKKNEYMRTLIYIHKNPEKYKSILEQKYRSQFSKDVKHMFYAAEIEEILIKQYHAMIFKVFKVLRIPNELYETMEIDGMIAIRSAIWNYRHHESKASFSTFCYNSILMRISGGYGKIKQKRARNAKRMIIMNESDLQDFNWSIYEKKYSNIETDTLAQELENIIQKCKLNEQEGMLIRLYALRNDPKDWHRVYREKYKNPMFNGKPLSRQSVLNHLAAVQKKIYMYLRRSDNLDVAHFCKLKIKTKDWAN